MGNPKLTNFLDGVKIDAGDFLLVLLVLVVIMPFVALTLAMAYTDLSNERRTRGVVIIGEKPPHGD